MTGNEIFLSAALIVVTLLGVVSTRYAWRNGVIDGAQNRHLPHVRAVLMEEAELPRGAMRVPTLANDGFSLEKGGFNRPSSQPSVRSAPPPPMYRGSIFPHFDVDVPMPKGTADPRV